MTDGVGARNRRTWVWLAMAVVASMVGFVLWRDVPATPVEPTSANAEEAQVLAADHARSDEAVTRTGQGRSAEAARVKAFEALKAQARAGDALAQRKLAEAYDACFIVNVDRKRFVDGLPMTKQTLHDPAQIRLFEQLAAERLQQCDAVDGGAFIPSDLIRGWYAQAAENGDLAARLMDGAFSRKKLDATSAARLLEDVMGSNDPGAVFAFGNALGPGYPAIAGDPTEPLVTGEVANWAWMVAACRMGYDCGPTSAFMGNMCLHVNSCTGEDFEGFVKRGLRDEAERRDLERRVTDILRAMESQ